MSRRLANKKQSLILRSQLLTAIRQFFLERDFIEVQTPIRLKHPALEDYIDALPSDGMWLRTSPELHMKQMVAAGMERIFQIGSCFRADEHGSRHRCEFTMLEWYQAHADYRDLLPFTQEMVQFCAEQMKFEPPTTWQELTVDDAFRLHTDTSAVEACEKGVFDELLIDRIEPALSDGAVFMIDYPAELGALARLSPTNPTVAERWELYINGLEIANTYSELIDPAEQRERFEKTAALRRGDNRAVYPVDEAFLASLASMPPSAGSALGVDRLLMALTGQTDIENVLAFTE